MRVECFPYEALISGTLECFYDSRCLNATARWISKLSPSAWPMALNKTMPSRFHRNTWIGVLSDEDMIEEITITKNFSGYYHYCSPSCCTYIMKKHNTFIYMLTLVLSLYGGLTMALRIIVPLLVQCSRILFKRFFKRISSNSNDDASGVHERRSIRYDEPIGLNWRSRILHSLAKAKDSLGSINLFEVC